MTKPVHIVLPPVSHDVFGQKPAACFHIWKDFQRGELEYREVCEKKFYY